MRRLALLVVAIAVAAGTAPAQGQPTVGLLLDGEEAFAGYTLFSPMPGTTTYLIDNTGKQIHAWDTFYLPGLTAYLKDNGNLVRTGQFPVDGSTPFNGGGRGGRIQELGWDGTLLWDYTYSNNQVRQHHDIELLPGGNILLVAWEYKSGAEAIAAGRDPALLSDGELFPLHVVEVEPVGASGGNIVWEWHLWDHLIQDFDPTKTDFGVVTDHPERVDVNHVLTGGADWIHANSIDYNATLDQILVSASRLGEVWVIDHSTTTGEAAGPTGGNAGRGGDLLYRWGNPQAYDRGVPADQKLFRQHDSRWIPPEMPGAGNILIFNNGAGRPGPDFSSVEEIVPPVEPGGTYSLPVGATYGPATTTWTYTADPPTDFFANFISGAERLPNGNTLVCNGPSGTLFELTPSEETVWRYVSPIISHGTLQQGSMVLLGSNTVFRGERLAPSHPGLAGQDLTPGDPLELFDTPLPTPSMSASRTNATGTGIRVSWDVTSCAASDYHLIFGDLAAVAGHATTGAECGIGTIGTYDWTGVPAGDHYFLIVGVDTLGVYESSWGTDSAGVERNGGAPSALCGVTTKITTATCP